MDKVSALTSSEFKKYWQQENNDHNPITTGLMGANNGHTEIQHKTLIPILTKTKYRPATKMRHVDGLRRYLVMHITYNELTLKNTKAQENDPFISSIKLPTNAPVVYQLHSAQPNFV